MLINQVYYAQNNAYELDVLLDYFELSGCSIRENDCLIRKFQFYSVHLCIVHIQLI